MELLAVARMLWQHRIAVAVTGVVALGLGLYVATRPPSHVGAASVRMVLDTPRSQTLEVAPKGLPMLYWRAEVLGDLMAGERVRKRIAAAMGISERELAISAPARAVPVVPDPLPDQALTVAATMTEPYQLAIQPVPGLPMVAIDSGAPTRAEARRLAASAADALKTEAAPSATAVDGFVVEPVGPVRSRDLATGPERKMAVVITLVVFGFGCSAIVLLVVLSRTRRRSPTRHRRLAPS
jgi:hypothetical protein